MEISKLSSTSLHWKYTLRLCYRTPAPIGLAQWFQYHSASVVCPRTYNIMMEEGQPQSIFSRIHFLTSLKCSTYFCTFLWILNYSLCGVRAGAFESYWNDEKAVNTEMVRESGGVARIWLQCLTVGITMITLSDCYRLYPSIACHDRSVAERLVHMQASRKCHNSYLYWFNHILPETSRHFLFCNYGNNNFCGCVCICGNLFSLCRYH